jgi:uncharacterized membrane protein
MPGVHDDAPRASLAVVLLITALTLSIGWAMKAPCLGSWADGRQYTRLCYSDVAALYASDDRDRGLDERRFPYLDGQNEYPVLTGITMWTAALPATSYSSYFVWTSVLLAGAAGITAIALHRTTGRRALLFAAAPTLAIYAFVNWDLIAVALATAATVAYLRNRDVAAGVLLGLGAAAKLYPALLVIPFALGHLRAGRRDVARRIVAWSAGTWLAVNLPFALFGFDRWWEFFRFNAQRVADWDSLWFVFSRAVGFTWSPALVNALAAAAFVLLALALWWVAERRRPGFAAWTFGFPLLVAFLLTGKVYSPQYGLWLLPWFALTLPSPGLFLAFGVSDALVFYTRFTFFAELQEVGPGLPFWPFGLAILLRAAVLVAALILWVRGPAEDRVAPRERALAAAA